MVLLSVARVNLSRPVRKMDSRMRIAQIAPCWLRVPPEGYGGIEYVVSVLTDGLVDRGHDVTLFAAGGSKTKAELRSFYDSPLGAGAIEQPIFELPHVVAAYAQGDTYDIVHDHTTFGVGPSLGARLKRATLVHTVHAPASLCPPLLQTYEMINSQIHLVAVSESQRQYCPSLRFAATVHNGIPLDRFRFSSDKDDYVLFVGRMCREKGVHLAIRAAQESGRRLLMGVKMHEALEREYFESEIKDLLTPNVEILGELSFAEKIEVFARARCTLMPVQWPEPFGLVAIESLACGTPVVALRNGALAETVEEGVTGILADTMQDFVRGIELAANIDPASCRRSVEERFSVDAMVRGYENVFERVSG
jgi:glycosyltransferase involved in cell wall biosynthesis